MNQGFIHTKGILDTVSLLANHDVSYVLPTLDHALAWWRIVRTAINETHGVHCVTNTKTACVTRCNHRALRLWVPYERDPEMPMDFPHRFRHLCDFVSPYYTRREMRALASS